MKILKALGLIAALALIPACDRDSGNSATGSSAKDQSQGSGQGSSTTPDTSSSRGSASANSVDADNTGKNARDRSDATVTPGDQGGTDADREITRQIRRTITSNDQLSTTAKNIKIMTRGGKVTLRGPVQSDQERQAIADAAQKAAGVSEVDNQLEVKTQNQ